MEFSELEKQNRNRALADRLYGAFLKEVSQLPEAEWRLAALCCVNRLLHGMECSLSVDAGRERARAFSNACQITEDAFGHWILRNEERQLLAWTGSGWAPIHGNGLPAGDYQVCNFATREDAREYAVQVKLTVREALPKT
jgi:hypothetical protein